jgi:hypothetical protein
VQERRCKYLNGNPNGESIAGLLERLPSFKIAETKSGGAVRIEEAAKTIHRAALRVKSRKGYINVACCLNQLFILGG